MNRARGRARALAFLTPLLVAASDPVPGAYCPFPEEGKLPSCMREAESHYSEFFTGLEDGRVSDEEAARLEADLARGSGAPRRFEAVSSLAYGYYLLSRRAAASGSAEPELVARLERWNELLAGAYGASEQDARYREAVREAAFDLQRRAPAVRLTCRDEMGRPSVCDSTDAVVRGMIDVRDRTGLRGALGRLLERIAAFFTWLLGWLFGEGS